ncbi:unnamed protein product [Symbiodinium pilosum]|uniref:Pentatricopeptide repeat-containing protein, chloroplastic n=1 Tax=Symbiodinium pilosum TaxID=2952 RepID=A0A812VNX7_SYMPI|nr:unnamed protein product [Symbiodinium pilosum]
MCRFCLPRSAESCSFSYAQSLVPREEIQEHGRWHLATCLAYESVQLNAIILTNLINSCARKGFWAFDLPEGEGIDYHCSHTSSLGFWEWSVCLLSVKTWSVQADILLQNAALRAFAGASTWAEAVAGLDAMDQRSLAADVYSASAVLKACESGGWRVAAEHLRSFLQLELEMTAVNYNVLMRTLETFTKWQQPLEIIHGMKKVGIEKTVISVASATAACGNAERWQHALAVVHGALLQRLRTNLIACNAAASACEKPGQWRQAVQWVVAMRHSGVQEDCISCNAVMSSLEKGGIWQKALEVLDSGFQQFEASVVTFSAVISCCETASRWLEALEVLRCLPKSRLTGNCYTFNAAVSACEKGSCWLGAVWLLYEMKMAAWQLDMISYNAAISACSSSSQWRSILLLFAEMTLWELQKDVTTYEAAVGGMERGDCSLEAIVLLHDLEAQYLEA